MRHVPTCPQQENAPLLVLCVLCGYFNCRNEVATLSLKKEVGELWCLSDDAIESSWCKLPIGLLQDLKPFFELHGSGLPPD